MSETEYLNINIIGDSDEPKKAEYFIRQNSPILQDANNFSISCIRFKIPSNQIETCKFNENDYTFTFIDEADGKNYTQSLYSNEYYPIKSE